MTVRRWWCHTGRAGSTFAATLAPANKAYKPIILKEELKIAGVVTAVIRKY